MAYNNPYLYPQAYYPMQAPTQPQQNVVIWVQGEAGAKSYLVGAGQSVLLMDSESSTFYIKSTDNSGMPMPLRVFDYKERVQATPAPQVNFSNSYVTHDELDKWTKDLLNRLNGTEDRKDGE